MKNLIINNNYINGELKFTLIVMPKKNSLQSFWIKRLFDDNFHDYKILPFQIIHKVGKELQVNLEKFRKKLQVKRVTL